MKRSAPYAALGGVFEYLNSDCGYDKWSQYLIERLRSLNAGGKGVDIGCGNGYFTRALNKAGYSVSGMDISPEMLTRAVELARSEGVSAEFLYGDITKLKLAGKVDFITAINDCINYVPQEKLLKTFKGVHSNLKAGGIFIFDISSAEKLEKEIGDNTFASDDEEVSFIWYNTLKEDRVEMEITVFKRGLDGTYSRTDEFQTQYIHREKEVISALESVGFSVQTEGHLGGTDNSRINFICRKI